MFNQRGFVKQMQGPGATQGETNGLYSAVTVNEIQGADFTYLEENTPPTFRGWWDDFRGILREGSDAVNEYNRARYAYENPAAPEIQDQWDRLTIFEKAALVIGVVGVVAYFIKK